MQTVVQMHHHRHLGTLGHRDKDHSQILQRVIRQQHLGRAEDDRRAGLLSGGNDALRQL